MRVVGLDYEARQLTVRDSAPPALSGSQEVLFRVHEVGVCGTDRELAWFRLGFPPAGESFLTLGHEALGQVVEIGREASGFQRGDWVVPMVRRACVPPCVSCARGRRDLCLTGRSLERGIFGLHGYFSDYAVDTARDLVSVPEVLLDCAVLIEPLSVVEKVVETALRYHEPGPVTALVLGAGPIGLLAALVLQLKGLETAVYSLEAQDHPRARLAREAGLRYLTSLENVRADIVIEATGSPEATFAGLRALAPLGVCGVLGSPNARGDFPFRDLLLGNQVVFGSVNAAPHSFARARDDLRRMDRSILTRMIRRVGWGQFRETIPAPAGEAAKTVHVLE